MLLATPQQSCELEVDPLIDLEVDPLIEFEALEVDPLIEFEALEVDPLIELEVDQLIHCAYFASCTTL